MRLIDADALIEALDSFILDETTDIHGDTVREILERLPTIEERKTGKWVIDDEYIDCSVCRHDKWSRVPFEALVKRFKFCPNCGADMRGER